MVPLADAGHRASTAIVLLGRRRPVRSRLAGFEPARVDVPTEDDSTLTVELDDSTIGDDAAAQAADVVWDNAPIEFDAVEVRIGDGSPSTFTDDELESRFGPRPATLNVRAAP